MRDEIDVLFAAAPQVAGVLRAMLLGDRNFVDRAEALDFQKTGVFHVLVVAGLHVGALAFALYWIGRKLRLSRMWTTLFTLTMLAAYVGMVEQRTPVLRAAMMAAIVVLGGFFFRRLELLNSAAVAAVNSACGKTARPARLELPIDVRGYRLHYGTGASVAGENGTTLCTRAARLA